jgi:hypothetical protein
MFCILSMIFTVIPHHFLFHPSVRSTAAVSPITFKAFRCDRFGFLPGIITVNSRHFYHDLSTIKTSITLDAPHLSVVVAFIGLVIQKAVSMFPSPDVDQVQLASAVTEWRASPASAFNCLSLLVDPTASPFPRLLCDLAGFWHHIRANPIWELASDSLVHRILNGHNPSVLGPMIWA